MTFDHRWSILTRIRGGSKGMITMLQTLRETLMLSSKDSLARAFLRLGWAGLGIQIVIGSIPILLTIYALIFGRNTGVGTRAGSLPIECLTIAALIVTVFTTIWSYRYTRLGKQIADPARRPSEFEIRRVAWIGCRKRGRHTLFNARNIVRGRAASDLFPPSSPGRRTSDPDYRGVDRRVGYPRQT